MVIGIALFGVLTAGIAAYFVHNPAQEEQDDATARVLAKFDSLEARLASLEARLDEQRENAKRETITNRLALQKLSRIAAQGASIRSASLCFASFLQIASFIEWACWDRTSELCRVKVDP